MSAIELFPALQGNPSEIFYMKNEGNIHDSYEIRFPQGERYVLQRINDQVFTDPDQLMSNVESVLKFLSQKTTEFATSLYFLPTHLGAFWGKNDFGVWRAMPYLGCCVQTFSPRTLAHAMQSARAFGLFSRYLKDFEADRLVPLLPGFHDTCGYLEKFQKIVNADPQGRLRTCKKEADALLELLLDKDLKNLLGLLGRWENFFPSKVIHGDAKYSNVVLSEDGETILSVIDLDTVMKGPIMYDLGDFLRTVCPNFDEESTNIESLVIRKDYYQECVRCYLDGLGDTVEDKESQHLYMSLPLVSYELSLRFLLDYLQGDKYFKTDHCLHNLDRARNQLQLVKIFLQERDFFRSLHSKFFAKRSG